MADGDGEIVCSSYHPLLSSPHPSLASSQAFPSFVRDGSVDYRGLPSRRSRSGGWLACLFIIGYEVAERVAYYGIASNLVTYLKDELHEGTASAATNVNTWVGVTTVLPIIGAFIADAYMGRYWTIALMSIFYVIGLILLTVSISISEASVQITVFFSALYLISVGTGGVKPCLEAFGADQFDEEDPIERKRKSSFFNWWYFGLCFGSLLAFTVIVYIEDNAGWGLGFGILSVLITLAAGLFLAGASLYRNKLPGGSPLTRISQVFVAAMHNWNKIVPHDSRLLYEIYDKESLRVGRRHLLHTNKLRCLDKAAMVDISKETLSKYDVTQPEDLKPPASPAEHSDNVEENAINHWRLCTVTQVEEVKLIVRIIPIWITTVVFGLVISQATTFFVEQAATLDRSVGSLFEIPSASLLSISSIVILILLPIYDRIFVPVARRSTGHEKGLTLLQRLGVGIFLSILCMASSALVEMRRLQIAQDNGLLDESSATIPMSVFWLLPQYIILGVSDVFALVGQQEFFYDQVPDTMRSLGMALYLCANGFGSLLSSVLLSITVAVTSRIGNQSWIVDNLNRCHLDYYYWLLAVLSTLNLGVYLTLAWFYTYKTVETYQSMLLHEDCIKDGSDRAELESKAMEV